MSTLKSGPPIVLDIAHGFDDAAVFGCYEQAYNNAGEGNLTCDDISSEANIHFRVGSMFLSSFLPFFLSFFIDFFNCPLDLNRKNVALGKVATQSSTVYGEHAGKAIDGDEATNSHTNKVANAPMWWSVDLLHSYRIDYIEIVVRDDLCCRDQGEYFGIFFCTPLRYFTYFFDSI